MPADLAEHAHLFIFFVEDVVGANGTAAHEGSLGFDRMLEGYAPGNQIYVLPPRDRPFSSLDRNHTPT